MFWVRYTISVSTCFPCYWMLLRVLVQHLYMCFFRYGFVVDSELRWLDFASLSPEPQSHWIGVRKNWNREAHTNHGKIDGFPVDFPFQSSDVHLRFWALNSNGFQSEDGPGGSGTRKLPCIFLDVHSPKMITLVHDTLWQFDIAVDAHHFR